MFKMELALPANARNDGDQQQQQQKERADNPTEPNEQFTQRTKSPTNWLQNDTM